MESEHGRAERPPAVIRLTATQEVVTDTTPMTLSPRHYDAALFDLDEKAERH